MKRRWLRVGLAVLGWLALLVGAVGVGLHAVGSGRRLFVLAASGAGLLMLATVLGAALLIAARSKWGVVGATVVAVAAAWTQLPVYVADGAPANGPTLTVMQSNVLFGGADPDAIVREVRDRNVDLLTIEELTPEAVAGLRAAGLESSLPHHHLQIGGYARGTGIWSRYPLSDEQSYDGFVLHQVSATMHVPGGPDTKVLAAHPVPPYPLGPETWQAEMDKLRGIMESFGDVPAIVGGDFNATYDHAQFRALVSGRFSDAADQAGAGILPTYPTDRGFPPVVAIDHVLVAAGRAEAVDSVTIPGSDHRAVVARIRMN